MFLSLTNVKISNKDFNWKKKKKRKKKEIKVWYLNCRFPCKIKNAENSIQLFNGSAGNRSKYFSRGIGKDQTVLLPEDNERGQ